MKKLIAIALCAVCLFSLAACGSRAPAGAEGSAEVGMVNPFVTYDTIEDACAAAGFDYVIPETIEACPVESIQVMNNSLIQITYYDSEADGNRIVLRKAAGVDDISGDYNEYPTVSTVDYNGVNVIMRGENDTFSGAIWTADGASYSVQFDIPVTDAAILAVVDAVQSI